MLAIGVCVKRLDGAVEVQWFDSARSASNTCARLKLYCGWNPSPIPRPSVVIGSPLRSSIQPHTTAYTITINSQSSTNLDEAILPLTEDKTRF